MNDSISRQDAIDALDDIESEVADGFGFQYEKWRKHFADLPSAQPKIGNWDICYDDDAPQDGIWLCSVCGYARLVDDISPQKYCPNCGTKMRGEEDA